MGGPEAADANFVASGGGVEVPPANPVVSPSHLPNLCRGKRAVLGSIESHADCRIPTTTCIRDPLVYTPGVAPLLNLALLLNVSIIMSCDRPVLDGGKG